MRYEVRRQDEKWIVWDTVNDCAKVAVGSVSRPTVGNRELLVLNPNSATIEARPAMFRTPEEGQELADT